MYIYADESGHSGRQIFNDPETYLQGAILSVDDIEPIVLPIVEKYCKELGVDRLHANEILPHKVTEIAGELLLAIHESRWEFHLTIINKPYISTTKFVDTIFDNYENVSVPSMWYQQEFFRHTLCLLFNKVLTDKSKKQFWDAFLKDDPSEIKAVIKNAMWYLPRYAKDKRLLEVATQGLDFAYSNIEEITMMAARTKKSYKMHSPNMIAFTSLIKAVHEFCENHTTKPIAFYHDQQCEFGPTMREMHKLLGSFKAEENHIGMMTGIQKVDYDLGKFSLPSSRDLASLQVVDIFLWLIQRTKDGDQNSARDRLFDKLDEYSITPEMSKAIHVSWLMRLDNVDVTQEDEIRANKLLKELEVQRKEKLNDFIQSKL